MRIGISADHGGLRRKEALARDLREAGHEVVDFGATHLAPEDDYPDYVVPMARAVARGEVERGIAVCGSGVGACIAANKVPGVRAALCTDAETARGARRWNDANVLAFGLRLTSSTVAKEMVDAFLATDFDPSEAEFVAAVEPTGGAR